MREKKIILNSGTAIIIELLHTMFALVEQTFLWPKHLRAF
jgi:hypothetical protein